jgi:hypothetical protein
MLPRGICVKSIDFLLSVWKVQCRDGDYVALSSINAEHDAGTWRDITLPYNSELPDKLQTWLEKHRDDDVYFCPLPFTKPKRAKNLVARSHFLWSDIDEGKWQVAPPSVLWESSPGRFQGLWRVDELTPNEAAEQSRSLAYRLGADKGGWDLTQVLRIPGTKNYKYSPPPTVKLIHFKTAIQHITLSIIDKYRKTIPRKLLNIITGPASGDRSERLWHLEHELCDLGIPVADAIEILRDSDWNKYRGRPDEHERFSTEIAKITGDREAKGTPTVVESRNLIVLDYASMMKQVSTIPGWLVRDWWMKSSHGMVAGEPKSFKSTLLLDMLFCIASDSTFLGSKVEFGGPVIVIQNENSDWIMQDRLQKMALNHGEIGDVTTGAGSRIRLEWARNLPIFFINQQGFSLDDASDRAALEDVIRQLKPVAICLDPLYLMFAGDVNSAKDLNPVLNWCLSLKQEYNTAIMLVHHYNKGGEGKRGGQRMLGSTTLHGWNESAWYIQAQESQNGEGRITVDREFRGSSIYDKVDLSIKMGGFGDPTYGITVTEHATTNDEFNEQVLAALETSLGPVSKTAIAKQTGLSRRVIDGIVDGLVESGIIQRKGERYQVSPAINTAR